MVRMETGEPRTEGGGKLPHQAELLQARKESPDDTPESSGCTVAPGRDLFEGTRTPGGA